MKKSTKKNLRVFTILTTLLLVSVAYLWAMLPVCKSIVRYVECNQDISYMNETADKYGWTDGRKAEVKNAKANREEIAKEDGIFGWCYSAIDNPVKKLQRDVMIAAMAVVACAAAVIAGVSIWILTARQSYYFMRLLKKAVNGASKAIRSYRRYRRYRRRINRKSKKVA